MFESLIKLANSLDKLGLMSEANIVDNIFVALAKDTKLDYLKEDALSSGIENKIRQSLGAFEELLNFYMINKSLTKPINVALVAGKSYPYKYMPLFINNNKSARFIGLGWMNASPLNISLMKINKITDFNDLIDRTDVVLITSLPVIKMILTYLNENTLVENNHLTYKAIVKNEIPSSLSEYETVYIWQIISEHQQ